MIVAWGDTAIRTYPTDSTVHVLGPVALHHEGAHIIPKSAQQRAILGLLALEAGPVPEDRLVAAVWGDERMSRSSVTVAVHRLRKWLASVVGERIAVVFDATGYRLRTEAPTDVAWFLALCDKANDRNPAERAEVLGEALGLWRGDPLDGMPVAETVEPLIAALQDRRRAAAVDYGAALVALGRAAAAVPVLTEFAERDPLDEPVQGALMEALAACGRQADALRVYERVRLRLGDELGVPPSRGLSEAMVRVLRQESPEVRPQAAVRPAQLPFDVPGFTGRVSEVDTLSAARAGAGNTVVISAVSGTGGVGKTALAVHWAHQVAGEYPDGQLYLDLRGYSAQDPVRPIDALGRLLRSLGADPGHLPTDVDEAAAAYRSMLAGRRVLVLLDNAATAAQVRPLLPADPGCLALITSRDRLDGLVVSHGARRVDLDVLSAADSLALLTSMLGPGHDETALAELADLCGHLPLALRIVAANLLARPGTTAAEQVSALRGDRLGELVVPGDPASSVRAAFDLSYVRLAAPDQRLFRLLGLNPGPDLSVAAAAQLAGAPVADTADALARLLAAHLVTTTGPGRYGMHDVVAAYAREHAATEPAAERDAALLRLHHWYLGLADEAARRLNPQSARLPRELYPDRDVPVDFDPRGFTHTESANLLAVGAQATTGPDRRVPWLLTDAILWHLSREQPAPVLRTLASTALRVAEADDEPHGVAVGHRALGYSYRNSDPAAATKAFEAAVPAAHAAGWRQGEVAARTELGAIALVLGDLDLAITYGRDALAASRTAGSARVVQANLHNLAGAYWRRGHLAQALELLEEDVAGSAGSTTPRHTRGVLATVLVELGRPDEAVAEAARACAEVLPHGDPWVVALTLSGVCEVYVETGRLRQAKAHAATLLAAAEEVASAHRKADAHEALGNIARAEGDLAGAHRHLTLAVRLARGADYSLSEVTSLITLGTVELVQGKHTEAVAHVQCALALADNAGYRLIEADACTGLARIHLALGHLDWAASHADRARTIAEECGARPRLVRALLVLGDLAHARGDVRAATDRWRQCLDLAAEIKAPEAEDARRMLVSAAAG